MVTSPVAVSVALTTEQSTEEPALVCRIRGLWIAGLGVLLRWRRLRRGIKLRLSLSELFKFAVVQKDASTSGALVDFNAETRNGQHLRPAFGTEHNRLGARTIRWLRHVGFPLHK